MTDRVRVRPVEQADLAAWTPLWDGYNAFYGRAGSTALSPEITVVAWRRFFDANEPVFALVAESAGRLVGLTPGEPAAELFTTEAVTRDGVAALKVSVKAAEKGTCELVYRAPSAAGLRPEVVTLSSTCSR